MPPVLYSDQCLTQPSQEKLPPAADGKRHTAKHYTESESVEHTALNEMAPSNPSPLSSGNSTEEEAEGAGEIEGTKGTRRTGAL